MIRERDMVRMSGGRMMRVVAVFNDYARCVYVDHEGRIQSRWFVAADLSPWWLAAGPRCLWPEVTDISDDDLFHSIQLQRRKRTKPKRSKKLKRSAE